MKKEIVLENTIQKLRKLDKDRLQDAHQFVDFLLSKVSDKALTKEIQEQAAGSESFSFLEEEELYSLSDLKGNQ